MKKLMLFSTGVGVVNSIVSIVKELSHDIEVVNLVDDSIVRAIAQNGNHIPPSIIRRITTYCQFGAENGAHAVLITCSSISEVVDIASPLVDCPVFKIDEPMAEAAVERAKSSIGIAATLQTTLGPTYRLLKSKVAEQEKVINIETELCPGAFEALINGDAETHDSIVRKGILSLLQQCDVVVLAQATMARAILSLSDDEQARVLTSPRLGVQKVLEYLQG